MEFLMKKVRFEEKSELREKFIDSLNFNKGNVDYDGILSGKSKNSLVIVMLKTRLLKFQQRKSKLRGDS